MSREGPAKSPIRFGKYEVARHSDGRPVLLGSGSSGQTYKAVHVLLGTTVALKVVHQGLAGDPEVKQRFLNEARAIAALRHPHIAQLVDCDEADGTLFYAMEYCDGGDLEKLAASRGPLPEETVLHLGRQTARALAHVHGQGYLHRDLKPSNLMLSMVPGKDEANLKVIDFGLVKTLGQASSLTQRGQFRGTLLYTSPEQLQHKDLDERTDVFSLGMTLWFLLEGKLPLQNSSQELTAQRLSGTSIAALLPPRIHPAVRRLLTEMMQPDLDKRIRDMHVVLTSIDECLAELHQRGSAHPPFAPAQSLFERPARATPTNQPAQRPPTESGVDQENSAAATRVSAPLPTASPTSSSPITSHGLAAPQAPTQSTSTAPVSSPTSTLPPKEPAPAPPRLGSVRSIPVPLNQKFEMLEDRGDVHGDLGMTYCARRVSTGDLVQLTQIPRSMASDSHILQELDDIVTQAGQCSGRFIIRPNALLKFLDHLVLIEELVDGLSLLTVLKSRQKLPLQEGASILAQLAEACDQAIQSGLKGLDLTAHRLTLQFPHMMGARIDARAAQKLLARPTAQWPYFVLRVEPDYEASYLGTEADLPCRFARLLYHMLSGMPVPASGMGGRTGYISGLGEEGNRLLGKVISGEQPMPDCLSLLTRLWQMESLPLSALSPRPQMPSGSGHATRHL